MKVIFMGTPDFAAQILDELTEQHEVLAAYTRPDAVRGRGAKLVYSPVKQKALEAGIPVVELSSFKDPASIADLAALKPDVICVAAYGALLPREVLDIPTYGCINVHASVLPRWRGAAPIERSILAGDRETGVCIMKMEEGLDTGPYFVCRTIEIGEKNSVELTDELSNLGVRALLTSLTHIQAGRASWIEQDAEGVTYAHKIERHELDPQPSDAAIDVIRKIRASSENHPSRCMIAGKGVTVSACARVDASLDVEVAPGRCVFFAKRFYLGCADGPVEITHIKPDGKKLMDAKAFAAGIQGIKKLGCEWSNLNG